MNDFQLRKHIVDELNFDPIVNAAHIGVSVSEGIATLSGHVSSLAEKAAAEAAVSRIKGVRAIVETIDIVLPEGHSDDDETLAKKALSVIEWDTHIPNDAVKVKVENGWITLSGDIDSYFERRCAEDAVLKLSGVKGVTNHINMRPDAGAVDIERRIRLVLNRSSQLSGHNISADAFGGKVTLEGDVNCLQARQLAERAAWGVPGVVWVDNHITVSPPLAAKLEVE